MTETEERKAFVDAALSYVGTPYHHQGRIKGVGVDCATLLVCAAEDSGLITEQIVLPNYPPEWNLHRGSELYLATISKWCSEVPGPPQPGDIILWRFGRSFSHAGIVIDWPTIVHAYVGQPVSMDDAIKNQMLAFVGEKGPDVNKPRQMKILSHWSR